MINLKRFLTKKNIIIIGLFLFICFFWTDLIGFYMNLLNPLRPSIGNFWQIYNKNFIIDSTKNELFEIEKLKLVAKKKIEEDIKNLAVYLDSLHEITLERKEFLNLSHTMLNAINSPDTILVKILPFYFDNKWNKVILKKKNSFLVFYFIDKEQKALSDNLILDYNILNYKYQNIIIDTTYWLREDSVSLQELYKIDAFDLFKFCKDEYKKYNILSIKGLSFVFEQYDRIRNCYFKEDSNFLYICFDNKYYKQQFDNKVVEDFKEFLKLKEFGYK